MAKKRATLESLGFSDVDTEVIRRLIINVQGSNKTGKTNFALGAPGPIAVFDLDIGLEGVARKFATKDRSILQKRYSLVADLEETTEESQEQAEKLWASFKKDFAAVCASDIRTIVWDSATEAWELARLAEFGKLTQVQPWHYTQLNSEFRKILRLATETDKNFIVTHKMTEIYEDVVGATGKKQGRATGEYRRAGFKDMQYVVQVNLETFRDADGFGIKILDCRQDGDLADLELRKKECNFVHLATQVFPDTEAKDWR